MLKKILFYAFILGIAGLNSCEKDLEYSKITESSSLEEDNMLLEEIKEDILEMAGSRECTDPSEWEYTDLGSKACGGPASYIAFNTRIDVKEFLRLVDYYNEQLDIYNDKWGIISDCSIPPEPKWIDCENSKPVFRYN